MTPESRAVDAIRKALESRGCMVLKIHGNEYMPKGTPDLFVAVPEQPAGEWFEADRMAGYGRPEPESPVLAVIEVKAPGGKHPVSRLQERALKKWAAAGALAGVCRTPEEALRLCGLE